MTLNAILRTRRSVTTIGIVLCFFFQALDAGSQTTGIRETLLAIARGSSSAERAKALTARLDQDGVRYRSEDFVDRRMRRGTNIVVTLSGGDSRTILLGAHYDRVPIGQGALDNGAACAVLLELIKTFKNQPLRNTTLTIVFFDLEEGGLSGSQAYLSANQPLPAYALNLDVFGYGDTFFTTATNPNGALPSALNAAAADARIPVRIFAPEQYPDSDHVSMIRAGIETMGISLLSGNEIDDLVGVVGGGPITRIPQVLSIIHTARDTPQILNVAEMERAIPVLEEMLRLLDQR